MSNLQVRQSYSQITITSSTQAQPPTQEPQTPAAPGMAADGLQLSNIRSQVLDMEAKIAELKLKEEAYLAGMLNEQLDFLQGVAAEQKDFLMASLSNEIDSLGDKLERVSAYRELLPEVVEYGSIDYAHHMQISDREQGVLNEMSAAEARTMQQIDTLESYVSDVRTRANGFISRVNSDTAAGTDDMDKRLASLRSFLGELASSPISRNLIAARFQ